MFAMDYDTRDQIEINLINLVRERPAIYETSMKSQYSSEYDAAWTEIANELGLPVDIVREKWKGLRDIFRRCHKTLTNRKRKWKHYDRMQFIIPYFRNSRWENLNESHHHEEPASSKKTSSRRRLTTGLHQSSPQSETTSDYNYMPEVLVKIEENAEENDPIEIVDVVPDQTPLPPYEVGESSPAGGDTSPLREFFNAMYETCKHFTKAEKLKAKKQIFQIVCDIEASQQD